MEISPNTPAAPARDPRRQDPTVRDAWRAELMLDGLYDPRDEVQD